VLFRVAIVSLTFALVAPGLAGAQGGPDPLTVVNQFRETLNLAKMELAQLNDKRGSEKTAAKRGALELLSRAWIILHRIPENVRDDEDLGEAQRFVEDNLQELGSDPRIRRVRDDTLEKGIQLFRQSNLSEALMMFEELRMLDPRDQAIAFLVKHINKKLDEEE